jgi:guanylate kinase
LGRLLVLTGVSGSGKGTIARALLERHPEIVPSVSVTTRTPRPGEIDGVHYRFVADDEFDRMVAGDELLEWVQIYGHRSGTPRAAIEKPLAEGRDVLLEVDVRGARFAKERYPGATAVFLALPSTAEQRRRLAARGTSGPDLERRLTDAASELAQASAFDAVVVNDDLTKAIEEVEAILFGSALT